MDDTGWHDSYLMITNTLLVFDNLKHNLKVIYNIHLDDKKINSYLLRYGK